MKRCLATSFAVFALLGVSSVLANPSASEAAGTPTARVRVPADAHWVFRMPKEEMVTYRGVLGGDANSGASAQLLYPAPNALGFLAAVLTHAAMVEGSKSAQRGKQQEEADKVLAPYQSVMSVFPHRDLMEHGLKIIPAGIGRSLIAAGEGPAASWLVESTPIFAMTQDQTALVLDHVVSVFAPGNRATVFQGSVKVVTRAREAADPVAFWTENQGERLKEESVRAFAHSIELLIGDLTAEARAATPQRTFRYFEGKVEKMERAELVTQRCAYLVVRTLRGGLMAIPDRNADPATQPAECALAGAQQQKKTE